MKFEFKGKEYYIDGGLKVQLDNMILNIKDDWDFVIVITGDRTVRVGKSVLGITVCAYLASCIIKLGLHSDPYTVKDIYFDNQQMIKEALKKPMYSINHYDEGREGLAASKAMSSFQKDLLDFFAECGQLNQIFVIVLPDFFELKEQIAVPRSEMLLNVYRGSKIIKTDLYNTGQPLTLVKFERGYFDGYCRHKKRDLYDLAKSTKKKDYRLVHWDFHGRFTNQYPVDEEAYRAKKKESLARFTERKEEEKDKLKPTRYDVIRDKLVMDKHREGLRSKQISEWLAKEYNYSLNERQVRSIINKGKEKAVLEAAEGI